MAGHVSAPPRALREVSAPHQVEVMDQIGQVRALRKLAGLVLRRVRKVAVNCLRSKSLLFLFLRAEVPKRGGSSGRTLRALYVPVTASGVRSPEYTLHVPAGSLVRAAAARSLPLGRASGCGILHSPLWYHAAQDHSQRSRWSSRRRGMYLIRMEAGAKVLTRRVTLMNWRAGAASRAIPLLDREMNSGVWSGSCTKISSSMSSNSSSGRTPGCTPARPCRRAAASLATYARTRLHTSHHETPSPTPAGRL